jgi:adenosylcobinamide-phosphate synthase
MVGALTVPVALVYWLLLHVSLVAAFAWNVLVVYLTLGFRHYSHYFTSIQLALNTGDEMTARTLLAEWTKLDTTAWM